MINQRVFAIFGLLFFLILLSSCAGIPKCENKISESEKTKCYEQNRINRGYYDFDRMHGADRR